MKIRQSEGGSGGGNGHSNMAHWNKTGWVKYLARKVRRTNDTLLVNEQSDFFEISALRVDKPESTL